MQLVLFRHGEAGSARRDFDRCLTGRGISDVRQVACALESVLCGARAYYSPYLRARQTCREIRSNSELQVCHELDLITPDDDPRAVIQWLQQQAQPGQTLLLVTHQPLISRLISLLAEGQEGGFYPMETASACWLEADDVWAEGLARIRQVLHAADLE